MIDGDGTGGRAVAGTWRDAQQVLEALTQLYYAVRFGTHPFSTAEFHRADELLARLRALPAPPADSTGPA